MYKHLVSNGPKECLEFADYSFLRHFGKATPSFPPREALLDYLLGRADARALNSCIRLNSAVRWVSFAEGSPDDEAHGEGVFAVQVEDLLTNDTHTHTFDHVIVATGHFSCPYAPYFDGMERFAGRVLHAHEFLDAALFAGLDLLVVGGSYSAEDVALQASKYGAKSVTISYRTRPMGFHWPKGVDERPLLQRVEDGRQVRFSDGSVKSFDAIVLCTGYLHSFPFLAASLELTMRNRLCPSGLSEGVV
jgi:trimethylamine monooxygenase